MKVKIVNPFSAEKLAGETEHHYGVPFVVVETDSTRSVMVADLPDDEAQVMIDAGRVVACEDQEKTDGPTREAMKSFLTANGVAFPANIKSDKLAELYAAEKAKFEAE